MCRFGLIVKLSGMQTFTQDIAGIDGTTAKLHGYVIDNSEEMDPNRVRPAIVVLPGGGYVMTSDREAEPVALRMLGYGYNAFVLRYSCAPSRWPVALLELAETMRQIRQHAKEWHVDPNAIVLMGFSAAGHLALSLATGWNSDPVFAEHGYKAEEIRPNAVATGYSVIDAGKYAHQGSINALVGEDKARDPKWIEKLSMEKHVTHDVPPTFLWHTATDDTVPVQNSLLFAQACIDNGVPVELHIFPKGGHGLSVGTRETSIKGWHNYGIEPDVQVWPLLFKKWMDRTFPAEIFD